MGDASNKRKVRSTSSSPESAAKRHNIDDITHPVQDPDHNQADSPPRVDHPQDESSEGDDEAEDEGEEDDELDELDHQQSEQGISDYGDDSDDDYFHQDDDDYADGFEANSEQEVEHITHQIEEKTMNIKCCTFEGSDGEFEKWLDTLLVVCSIDEQEIGRRIARYIKRGWIQRDFWVEMEAPCQETSSLAFKIFDRYGCLRQEFKEHPVRKGSGVWGSELDKGNILLIEEIDVDRDWRRKGVGKIIVEHLNRMGNSGGKDRRRDPAQTLRELGLKSPAFLEMMKLAPYTGRSSSFNLLIAGWLTRDVEDLCKGKLNSEKQTIRRDAQHKSYCFYRSLGYRRIGNTNCFGLALDLAHPARSLDASQDFDPVESKTSTDADDEDENVWDREEQRLETMQRVLPLHHAITTLPDDECLAFLKALEFSPTDVEWSKTDSGYNNILHVAATELKPKSVQWLLDTVDTTHKLSSARNEDGVTPLEAVQEALEVKRTRREQGMMTVVISDHFTGFSDAAIQVLLTFRALQNPNPPSITDLEGLRFGCTCGQCLGGFVSPRMSLTLIYQAQMLRDTLEDEIEDGEYWSSMKDYLMEHVAPDIQLNFQTNNSLRCGFTKLFERIAECLEREEPPTPFNVLRHLNIFKNEWPPFTRSYLDRGGKVEDALRVVFEFARNHDEYTGDGKMLKIFNDDLEKLKACRNDHEFGFVALLCDLPDL